MSRQPSFNEQVPEKEPSHVKLGVVARLRREVVHAQSNRALAAMVADFAKVTNKSTGRTITKVMNTLIDEHADHGLNVSIHRTDLHS
jgi:casein kinase 1